jgi:hypothetical protein
MPRSSKILGWLIAVVGFLQETKPNAVRVLFSAK